MRFTNLALAGVLAMGALGASCGSDEEKDTGTTPTLEAGTFRDLTVTLSGMTAHVGQLMEFRVVSSDNHLVARGLLDPLPSAEATFTMNKAVPAGSYELAFTADLNGNRAYDPPPADHAWRVAIPESGAATVSFTHSVNNLVDINNPALTPIGGDLVVNFSSMVPHVGQKLDAYVTDTTKGALVGRYELVAIPSASFSLTIPGIIADGDAYAVGLAADFNGNGQYDTPPTDHSWLVNGAGTATGMTVDFVHNTSFTDLSGFGAKPSAQTSPPSPMYTPPGYPGGY